MHKASGEVWQRTTLGAVARRLVNGGTPPTEIEAFWNGTIPWITGADFTSRGVEEFRRFVSDAAVRQTSTNVIQRGQILIVTRTGVGKLALAPCDIAISQDITGLYVDETKADPRFLFHRMRAGVQDLKRLNQGTSINGIIRSDLTAYKLDLPPLPVQRRIAEILSTLDTAIEQTEALIAKGRFVKTGLMHDLLTRGVLPDGSLRPRPVAAPELYNQTPIGPLPTGWTCRPLEKLLAGIPNAMRSGPFGSALLKAELVDEGVPFLGIDNIFPERFVTKFRRFLSPQKYVSLARYAVRPTDVIITIMGTVGRCCVVPSDLGEALSSKHLWTMTFDREKVLPDLICWQLNHAAWVKRWFDRHAQGAVMDAIQSSTLKTLHLPVPPLAEQEIICERYRALGSAISVEEDTLEKLRQQRQGLMHDLLTGQAGLERRAA